MRSTITSIVILLASLCIVLGPWMLELDNFGQVLTPENMGTLLPMVGGVLLAWIGKSPLLNR